MYSQYSLAVTTPSYAGYYYFLEKVVSVCGVRCVVCGVWCVVCGVQCSVVVYSSVRSRPGGGGGGGVTPGNQLPSSLP